MCWPRRWRNTASPATAVTYNYVTAVDVTLPPPSLHFLYISTSTLHYSSLPHLSLLLLLSLPCTKPFPTEPASLLPAHVTTHTPEGLRNPMALIRPPWPPWFRRTPWWSLGDGAAACATSSKGCYKASELTLPFTRSTRTTMPPSLATSSPTPPKSSSFRRCSSPASCSAGWNESWPLIFQVNWFPY